VTTSQPSYIIALAYNDANITDNIRPRNGANIYNTSDTGAYIYYYSDLHYNIYLTTAFIRNGDTLVIHNTSTHAITTYIYTANSSFVAVSNNYSITGNINAALNFLSMDIQPNSGNDYFYGAPNEVLSCLHANTLIKVKSFDNIGDNIGDNNINKTIDKINIGDLVYKQDGETVEVEYVIKFLNKTNKFIKLSKNVFITSGHPIMINGEEVVPETLVNGTTITNIELEDETYIYALCTTERCAVMTEGLFVLTWENKAFQEYVRENKILWQNNNTGDIFIQS
jgi:hypothetical protein